MVVVLKSWDWVRPPTPSLGQNPIFLRFPALCRNGLAAMAISHLWVAENAPKPDLGQNQNQIDFLSTFHLPAELLLCRKYIAILASCQRLWQCGVQKIPLFNYIFFKNKRPLFTGWGCIRPWKQESPLLQWVFKRERAHTSERLFTRDRVVQRFLSAQRQHHPCKDRCCLLISWRWCVHRKQSLQQQHEAFFTVPDKILRVSWQRLQHNWVGARRSSSLLSETCS